MKKIGKYKIVEILGKGAMGIVYKARDPDIGRDVAIKAVRFDMVSEGTEKEDIVERFMREARSAGKLSHPNIITIYDIVREGDLTYIVMQYVEGESLQKSIASNKKFSTTEIVELMVPLCDALDYAHQHGIVHRDIKPANILIDKTGKPFVVDFGVAHIETSTMTQTGTTLGTPSYMSPEQVMGKKVDNRSDIFSLGVILYELLTGQRPFGGGNISTIIYKIVNEEPLSIIEIDKSLPADFENVIHKALAKDPKSRYSSCKHLVRDLHKQSQTLGKTLALEMSEEERAGLEKRRKLKFKLILAISLGAIVILGGGGGWFLAQKSKKVSLPSSDKEVKKVKTTLLPKRPVMVMLNPIQEKLNKIKASMESEDFEEAIRIAHEILEEEADNITAQDYLNKAERRLNEIKIAKMLQAGILSYEKKNYRQCIVEMQKILTLDKTHKEARRYLYLANISLSRREIERIIESQRKAVEEKDLLAYLSHIGSSPFFDQKRKEMIQILNRYDDIKSLVSEITISFEDMRHASVSFSHLLAGVDKETGQKRVVFEGVESWSMEKQEKAWKITEYK